MGKYTASLAAALRAGLCGMMLVSALTVFAVQADDDWYPDPESLFAPGVQVEAVTVEDIPQFGGNENRPEIDNEARQLRLFDAETEAWLEFSYPEAITHISRAERYEDDMWLISTTGGRGTYGNDPLPSGQWLLNIRTGDFRQPELICGELREMRQNIEGRWVAYIEPTPENTRRQFPLPTKLCNTKTLEQRAFDLSDDLTGSGVNASPDGSKVAFLGMRGYYIYNLETDMLLRLGETTSYDIRSIDWYGNETLVVSETQRMDSSPWIQISVGNADEADSLERIATDLKPFGGRSTQYARRENPTRIEWIEWRDGSCFLEWLEQETGHRETFALGDLCTVGRLLSDDQRGERLFDPIITERVEDPIPERGWAMFRELYRVVARYDLATGERTDLLQGEVEVILDIDAERNYATIVLDANGLFDLRDQDLAPHNILGPETILPHDYQLALLDLHSGEILYRTPVGISDSPDWYYVPVFRGESGQVLAGVLMNPARAIPAGSLFSIGDGIFIERAMDSEVRELRYVVWLRDDRLIDVAGDETTETQLDGMVILTTADNAHFVMVTAEKEGQPASTIVYNRTTGENVPLITPITMYRDYAGTPYELRWNDYPISIERGSTPDVIEVKLDIRETQQRVIYRVRLG